MYAAPVLMFELFDLLRFAVTEVVCYAQAKPCIRDSTILRASVEVTW